MKAFSISHEQLTRVIGAASADELMRRFNKQIDSITIASWAGDTRLDAEGLGLTDEERLACVARICSLLNIETTQLRGERAQTFSGWVEQIDRAISGKLKRIVFTSAARDHNDGNLRDHLADEIYQDAAVAANLFHGRRRLLSLVAPHSLMGFAVTILTPNLQGIDSIDARGMTPDELSSTLMFGDALVATPSVWRYMVREGLSAPENAMCISFGEPMTPDLASAIRKAGFGAMRELYGSTETGLIGWRDSPGEPFLLFDHWRNEHGTLQRIQPDGRRRIVEAMDILDWDREKYFRLGGRRDGAVQIGAVNVFPAQIADTLCSHPLIDKCLIRVGKQGGGVNRLIAHIVLAKSAYPNDHTARDIAGWCRLNLRQQERPRIYNFETALPE